MSVSSQQLLEAFGPLLEHVPNTKLNSFEKILAPHNCKEGSLVFASSPQQLEMALKSDPSGLVVGNSELAQVQASDFEGTVFTSPAVSLALAKVGAKFFEVTIEKQAFDGQKIHASAVISKTAELDENVCVGPNSVIGPGVRLGKNVFIGANCVIEANCQLGDNTYIRSQVFIGQGTQIGQNCEVHPQTALASEGFGYAQDQEFNHHHIPHYGNLVLEDNVHIGAGCTADRGTFGSSRFGAGSIVDNLCHFGHNFQCGKKCIFVGGVMVAGSVTLGSGCVIGGRTTISGHLKITDRVRIAGLSGVTKDITEPGEYGGYPTQSLKDSLRSLSTLRHLPLMKKQIAELSKGFE